MSILTSERPKTWDIYAAAATGSDHTAAAAPPGGDHHRQWGAWKNFGTSSSMHAISFGFVATAILISMFLIMAIFEHLFRPNASLSSPHHHQRPTTNTSSPSSRPPIQKVLHNPHMVVRVEDAGDFPVLMPGQHYPTFIAQPAPLPREGVYYWPSHHHKFSFP